MTVSATILIKKSVLFNRKMTTGSLIWSKAKKKQKQLFWVP